MVLAHEGGFVDDPDDPGQATRFGISLRLLKQVGDDIDGDGDVDADDIRALTREDAAVRYKEWFWDRYDYGRFELKIAAKVFDLAVNTGPKQAHIILQRSVRAVLQGHPLIEDGILGPLSYAAVVACDSTRLLTAMRSEAAGFYRTLVASDPGRGKYLTGWLNRAYD